MTSPVFDNTLFIDQESMKISKPQAKGFSTKKKMLALLGLTLGLCGAAAYDYNLKNNYYFDGVSYFEIDWKKQSVPFLIQHVTSGKYVHPHGGRTDAGDETELVLYDGYSDACWWVYVPVSDKPGFGVIRHKTSGRYIHPHGGSFTPGAGTGVVLYHDTRYAATWSVQSKSKHIQHVGGHFWHPNKGEVTPGNNARIVVYPGTHEAT